MNRRAIDEWLHTRGVRWWGRTQCPVRQVEQDWIETSLDWLLAEFGRDRLHGAVLLPTDDFFPGAYR